MTIYLVTKLTFLFSLFILTPTQLTVTLDLVCQGVFTAIIGILIAVLMAIVGIVWFPIKRFFKKKKESQKIIFVYFDCIFTVITMEVLFFLR